MAIRQRTWTTSKGKQKSAWIVEYRDAKGKRRLKTFRTRREADDWRSGTKVDLKHGTHVADSDSITVEEAGKRWLATCEANELERSTLVQYRRHLKLHIGPLIGSTKLSKLTTPAARVFQDQLRDSGRSPALTRKVMTSLGSIVTDAMERGLATRNPVRERRRRSNATKRHTKRLEAGVDIPTPAEIRRLHEVASDTYGRALFLTAALSGLRLSELRGLAWKDVDLAASTVTVRQRADAWGTLGSPKAAASRRTIPAPPSVVKVLKEWKLACPRRDTGRTDAAGNPIRALDLVFPGEAGEVQKQDRLREPWHALQLAAGLSVPRERTRGAHKGEPVRDKDGNQVTWAKYPGFHALRHFYASWCIAPQKDGGCALLPKAVQTRMGHATLSMTMDLYGHLFPSTDDAEVLAAGERALMGV
jgi:integrase